MDVVTYALLMKKIKNLEVGEGEPCNWQTNIKCGGLEAGTSVNGKTVKEVLQMMTVAYVLPSCTVTYSNTNALIKQGTSINVTITAKSFTKGTNDITKIEFYNGSNIVDTQNYVTGTNSYAYTVEDIKDNTTLKVRVYDSQGKYKEFTPQKYTFVYPSYKTIVDVRDLPTATELATLIAKTENEFLLDKKGYTWNGITMTNKRMCYAYPKSYGTLTSIKDENNFEVLDSYTKLETKINGVDYMIYISTDTSSLINGKMIFS